MAVEQKVIISSIAYIKSLMYFQRFSSEFIDEDKFKIAYALLIGYIDPVDNNIYIEQFIPLKSFEDQYVIFEDYETLFSQINELNKNYYDEEFPSYILGWARNSIFHEFEPSLIDKENHLIFQTAINPDAFFWVFDHENLTIGNGIKLHRFKEDFKVINITSKLQELRYNLSENVYLDELVSIAVDLEEKRKNKEIIIKGIEEN